MKQRAVTEILEDNDSLAAELLRQGRRCAMAGMLTQAEALLTQVWSIALDLDAALADSAAWEVAWLQARRGAYAEAAEWFGRVAELPPGGSPLWLDSRQALDQLCRLAAEQPSGQAAPAGDPPAAQPEAPSALPTLKIVNLGCFQLTRAGVALPVCKARKATTILRYLLTRPHRTANKEELMELLWPDADPRRAAHSLHVAVGALRRHLDPQAASYLLFEGGAYTLNPAAPLDDDCASFQQFVAAAERCWSAGELGQAEQAYTRALACYQGDYYVDDHDATWAIAERERLLVRYLLALEHIGRILVAQQRFEQAITHYQRLLERDNYREDIYAHLMRCYWQLGRRGEALRQYERCAATLAGDLGIEPAQELRDLQQAISCDGAPERGRAGERESGRI